MLARRRLERGTPSQLQQPGLGDERCRPLLHCRLRGGHDDVPHPSRQSRGEVKEEVAAAPSGGGELEAAGPTMRTLEVAPRAVRRRGAAPMRPPARPLLAPVVFLEDMSRAQSEGQERTLS